MGSGDPRKLASSHDWGADRKIRGHVLAELLRRAGTDELPEIRRVRIRGARITGKVDLSHAEILVAVDFDRCLFEKVILLEYARIRRLQLNVCVLRSLRARGVSIAGPLGIRRSDVRGTVRLIDATVSQSVTFSGSTIAGVDGLALIADRIEVGGNLFLNRVVTKIEPPSEPEVFRATGAVRLLGARIDEQLNCIGGRFRNPGKVALFASSAQVGGNVYLSDGFHATGQVRLLSMRIGGQLSCSNGRFECPQDVALSASSARINGRVAMTHSFHATGEVRLMRARIGGQLNCSGGRFVNPKGTSLNLQTAQANSILLRNLAPDTAGRIDLVGSKVSILADDESSACLEGVSLRLDGFVYDYIAPESPQDVRTRLRWLRLQGPGYHPQPYDQLAEVFRRSGREQEARDVLISKRRARRESLRRWYSKIWDILVDWTLLYGWHPWRPLVAGALVLLVAIGLVFGAQDAGLIVGQSDRISSFHPLVYALDVFLPIIDLGVESSWTIDTSGDSQRAWLITWYLWFVKVVGWGTMTLALAALTGIVKRD